MYTDYGYSVDGVEYATVDEAQEAVSEAENNEAELDDAE